MEAKVLFFFILSLFGQSVSSQCISRDAIIGTGLPGPFGWPYEGPYDAPYGPAWPGAGPAPSCGLPSSYGGGLFVTSTSPIAPTGLTVNSENTIEGVVSVTGQLPFLGAVATDGLFSTSGAGSVYYGCGDGAVGIVSEAPIASAPVNPALGYGYGPGMPQYGYGPSVNGYNGLSPYGGCGLY